MSKVNRIVSAVAIGALLAVSAFAQTPTTKPAAKTPPPAKTAAPKAKAPAKTDAEIQSCIEGKLAAAPKLKDQHFTVAVSNGTATFTGTAKDGGSKGGVVNLAKSCGVKKVVNNITVEKAVKAATTHPAAKSPAKPK